MTGTTTDGTVVALRLRLSDWCKLVVALCVFVTGPVLGVTRALDAQRADIRMNAKDNERQDSAIAEQGKTLAEAVRLLERISGRMESKE